MSSGSSIITTIPVGGGPSGVVYDDANGYVYVANELSDNVTVVNGTTNKVVTSIPVGLDPFGLAFDSANGYIYVASAGGSTVTVINGKTDSVAGSIPVGYDPIDAAFDSSNGYVYVTNYDGYNVTVIDGATDKTVASIPVGGNPLGIAFDSTNGYIYEANQASDNVTVINGTTDRAIQSIAISMGCSAVVFDSTNGYIYVSNAGVTVINGVTNDVVGSISTSGGGTGGEGVNLAFDTANGYIYVANYFSDNVTVIDGSTDHIVASIAVGHDPMAVGFNSANGTVYVTNWNDRTVSVINGTFHYPTISSFVATPPTFVVGSSTNFAVTAAGGVGPLSYSYTGLPPGCTTTSTAALTCTPTKVGSYTVRVFVNDSIGNSVNAATPLTVKLFPISSFGANPASIVVGSTTSLDVSASGGSGTLSYDYTGLPPGCTTSNTAVLSCTPTKAGSYTVRVFVNDTGGNSNNTTTPLTVNLFPINSFTSNPSTIIVGSSTTFTVSATGGSGTLAYTYTDLPPGCTTANTDALSCTPTKVGSYSIRVFVNDSGGNSVNATTPLTVHLFPLTSFTATPSIVDLGTPTTLSVSATGGSGALSYTYTGLPPGCATSNTPTLSCTPTAAGPRPFTIWVVVNDSGGNSNSISTNLTVNAPPSVGLSANPSPTDAHSPVTFSATASRGTGPFRYTWLFGNGTNASGESVSHTFNSSGNYTVRAYANDTFGLSATNTILVTVYPQLVATLTVSNSTPLLGQTVAFVASAKGGLGPYNFTYIGFPPGCVSEDRPAVGCLPTQADYYNVTVHVRDQNNITVSATASIHVIFDFNVVVPATGSVGSPFTISVNTNETFSGGTAIVPAAGFGLFTYNYTGLPPGCVSQDAPSITCTPTQNGTYHITVSVHDEVGDHNSHTVVVNILPAKSTSGTLGLSGDTGFLVLGGVVAVAAALVAVFVIRSRRSKRDGERDAAAATSPSEPPNPPR